MGQESWHSGYMDKGNEKYKNDYCQNVLSISLVWILFYLMRMMDEDIV